MNPLETAKALASPVGYLGGSWMTDPATYEHGEAAGVKGRGFYFVGRGAAMGDVGAEVVAAAMAFFPWEQVTTFYAEGRSQLAPSQALEAFSTALWNWGRKRLSSASNLDRTAQLLARVVDGADAAGRPLFAGWREAPRPTDPAALTIHLLHVLRELRGGTHAIAVFASGITPVEAAVVRAELMPRFGTAESMGWAAPIPECTDELRARRAAAEELTDQMMAVTFAILSDSDRAELVTCVLAVKAASKTG
jgi:hypothetical protein